MSFSSLIYAEKTSDLLSLYNEALRHDALLSAATIQNKATQELIDQGLSLLLPNISAQGSYTDLDNSRKFNTPISNVLLAGTKADYQNYEYGVVVRQPIFNYASYNRYKQNLIQTSLSDKQLLWSRQDLIYRVVKLYFETLQASDEIDLLQAQRKEILAQLAEAEAMFNAGLVSITDVNETKTKAALIEVQQLNAVQLFKIKKREFETVTGSLPGKLNKLNPVITFTEVENKAEEWIDIAIENNLDLQIRRDEVKIADREIDIRAGDRFPTIDAFASRSRSWDSGGYPYGTTKNQGNKQFSDAIGVEINIPIYQGGFRSSRVREGKLLKLKLQEDEEYLERQVKLAVRENFLHLQTNFAEIVAYDVALKSAKLTLDSTNLGFKAGLRDSIDVLRAQQVYFDAEKDILDNKYDYLMNLINLKFSVGMLTKQDIIETNKYLIMEQ
jgi:TolC family type I secretion outer membrane protein|tara:strand:- start:1465 stop:2793 length:1329 start_codon:yes stop_codon:yes gene_type:complete